MALMQQQCKIEWINYGDDSSRIFYAKAKQRKLASYIYNIKNARGDLVEGFDQVGKEMYSYYVHLLGKQNTFRKEVDLQVVCQGLVLTIEQQLHMCRDFTDLDIKQAFFSIPNFKSPGPDGFNSGFYKATWQKIGPMVCAAIKEFFHRGSMPPHISETKLIMLPKVPHP